VPKDTNIDTKTRQLAAKVSIRNQSAKDLAGFGANNGVLYVNDGFLIGCRGGIPEEPGSSISRRGRKELKETIKKSRLKQAKKNTNSIFKA